MWEGPVVRLAQYTGDRKHGMLWRAARGTLVKSCLGQREDRSLSVSVGPLDVDVVSGTKGTSSQLTGESQVVAASEAQSQGQLLPAQAV